MVDPREAPLEVPHLTAGDRYVLRPWELGDLPLVREASAEPYIPLIAHGPYRAAPLTLPCRTGPHRCRAVRAGPRRTGQPAVPLVYPQREVPAAPDGHGSTTRGSVGLNARDEVPAEHCQGVTVLGDGAYLNCGMAVPHHKHPRRPLPAGEEADNAAHRKVRARVEHVSGRVKNYKILRDCRQHGDGLHHAVQAIAHMHNLALTS